MKSIGYTTRIAPSPTGMMHIGTARTAYFNWLAARASGGKFILRIDDTDTERHNEDAVRVIHDTMDWLGLGFDECHRQSERKKLYVTLADSLLKHGLAREAENGARLLNLDALGPTPMFFHDQVAGDIKITATNLDQMKNIVLTRGGDKLGAPTYHFASVVDDYTMGINYVIRGVDHITNTPKQMAIALALGTVEGKVAGAHFGDLKVTPMSTIPSYAHVGLIFKNKKKMSKRDAGEVPPEDNESNVSFYAKRGYHPEAILNFLLRMGWGPREGRGTAQVNYDIIKRDQALALFLGGGTLKATPANFDMAKLDWYDREYKKGTTS